MKKHKKIYSLFFGFIFLTSLTSCMGAELIGEGVKIAAVVGYAAYKESQVDKYQVNNYKIRVYEAEEGKKSVYRFDAMDENGEKVAGMYCEKDNISHVKTYNSFKAMKSEEEKKEFLRSTFLAVAKFDLGKEVERVQINGKYEVNVCEVAGRDGKQYIFFNVFKNKDNWQKVIKLDKSSPSGSAEIEAFTKMNPLEKKQYLQKTFLEVAKYDLGEIEEVPVKKVETTAGKETTTAPTSSEDKP
ncbi:MAG: hypothetical protein JW914_00725 [Syntrophaceae bacterium]|nr:hypothetical protein [Syntrophaceae bacterium]